MTQRLPHFLLLSDGHTIEKMRVSWKKGFDQSKVTENNYISLAQFDYDVFFEENYEEEIASGEKERLCRRPANGRYGLKRRFCMLNLKSSDLSKGATQLPSQAWEIVREQRRSLLL